MRQTIRIILFKTQSLTALTLAVIATQRGTTEWVSFGTTWYDQPAFTVVSEPRLTLCFSSGLAVWLAVSIVLLLISEDYLVRYVPPPVHTDIFSRGACH